MRIDTCPLLPTCLRVCVFVLAVRLSIAIPSATQLELPERDAPSSSQADSFHTHAQSQFASFAHLRDCVIDSIWQFFYPSADDGPQRRRKGFEPPPQLHAQYAEQLVLRFNVTTETELASLAEAADVLFLDVWAYAETWVDLRLAYNVVPALLGLLPKSLQQAHIPLMTGQELVRAVVDTYPSAPRTRHKTSSPPAQKGFTPSIHQAQAEASNVFFDDYRPLPVITHWMRLLESLFSTHARLITVGETHSGQPIQALRLGIHPTTSDEASSRRKTVLVTAGSHAREWISTSTVTYAAYALTTGYGRDKTTTRLLEEFDFIFVPTLNPDGYQYTWDADRLWRKTRQPTPLRFCRGLDLDRTWPFHWDDGAHSTFDNPCSESYAGASPLEAPESQSFAAWAKSEVDSGNTTFVALLDLHSYSEQILYPYSYSCRAIPPNLENLAELGHGLAKAIRASTGHENYRVLSACEGNVNLMTTPRGSKQTAGGGAGGGSMLDWFYHDLGVKHAFQIKLRDKGSYGFLLPKEFIVPTGGEVLRAVQYMGMTLSNSGPWVAAEEEEKGFTAGTAGQGDFGPQQPLSL